MSTVVEEKQVTFTCELHPDTSIVIYEESLEWARAKTKAWGFVGLQCFCPDCKTTNVLQSFTRIGGVLLRRRRDLERLQARIDFMQEQIDAMPAESKVMTLAYDNNTARLDKSERIILDVLVVQMIKDANDC